MMAQVATILGRKIKRIFDLKQGETAMPYKQLSMTLLAAGDAKGKAKKSLFSCQECIAKFFLCVVTNS